MSAPDLPDNLRDWPTDPFALLGVTRGAGEMDIKRAYTRLIRRFKPEHSPEHFRRIRQAYETCLDQYRWFASAPDIPDEITPDRVPTTTPSTTESTSDDQGPVSPHPNVDANESFPDEDRPTANLPPPTPILDEVASLWAAAIDGRDAEAYAGLIDLAAIRSDRLDLPLRLYWLLGLNPALDPTRTRHHWLADALRRSRLSGSAAELYRRELDTNPETALYGQYLDILASDSHPRDLLTVARWRLTAAGLSQSWHPAEADLQTLARRLPEQDEAGWLRFLVTAIDWTAWDRPNPVYTRARSELGRLSHLGLSHSYAFDRVEETEHITAGWRGFLDRLGPPGLFGLLPAVWAGTLSRGIVGSAVAAVASDPEHHLLRLDRAARERGPGFLYLLIRALEEYRRTHGPFDHPEFPADLIRGLARHLPSGWRREYTNLRTDLFNFLLAEAIHPTEFSAACEYHPDPRIREMSSAVRQDASLGLIWLACRLHAG